MKDDIADLVAKCSTIEEVKTVADDWMDYYNHDRYQMELNKLSPTEYYHYLLTGYDPLESIR